MNYQPEPVMINRTVEKTRIAVFNQCRERLDLAEPDAPEVVARIRRAGKPNYTLEYPATLENEDGKPTAFIFLWGEKLYSLAPGRYVADVYAGDEALGYFQMQLHTQTWSAEPKPKHEPVVSEFVCDDPCESD